MTALIVLLVLFGCLCVLIASVQPGTWKILIEKADERRLEREQQQPRHPIEIAQSIGTREVINGAQTSNGTRFRNPANGHIESAEHAFILCLLFGTFYFLAKGIMTHAILSALLAIMTFGVSWLIYPLFAPRIVATNYLRRGWLPV